MKNILILMSLLLLLFLSGCQPAEQITEEESVTPVDTVNVQEDDSSVVDPYPYPEPSLEPYVAPEEPTLEPYVFRTSQEGMVTIHGLLFVADPDQAMPNRDVDNAIFLVPIPEGDGVTMMPSFEIGEVPQADVDERTGEFVFTDIEPGLYIVMVYTNGNAKIPARNEEGSFAIFKITESDRDQTIEVNYLLVP